MRRSTYRLLRPLWVVLALLFMLEAWLWDHLEPIVARAVNVVPWGAVKGWIKATIERLPPQAALAVFVVPFIALLPLKFLEVYFLATEQWLGAIAVLVVAKLLGLGVTAFVFDATRDKLLQMDWFRRMYDWFMWARGWAHQMTEPVRARIHSLVWLLKPQRAGRFVRRLLRLRRTAYRKAA